MQGCCADKACTPKTCMDLPDGKTCGDCVHIKRCKAIFGHTETDTVCDWFPRKFRQRDLDADDLDGSVQKSFSNETLYKKIALGISVENGEKIVSLSDPIKSYQKPTWKVDLDKDECLILAHALLRECGIRLP